MFLFVLDGNFKIAETVKSTPRKIVYLIFYHIFFVMLCWSYWQTIFTEIGRVPIKV